MAENIPGAGKHAITELSQTSEVVRESLDGIPALWHPSGSPWLSSSPQGRQIRDFLEETSGQRSLWNLSRGPYGLRGEQAIARCCDNVRGC
jgi:hypothetical protein